jgi:hypothetical protein
MAVVRGGIRFAAADWKQVDLANADHTARWALGALELGFMDAAWRMRSSAQRRVAQYPTSHAKASTVTARSLTLLRQRRAQPSHHQRPRRLSRFRAGYFNPSMFLEFAGPATLWSVILPDRITALRVIEGGIQAVTMTPP